MFLSKRGWDSVTTDACGQRPKHYFRGVGLKKVDEYLAHAEECRTMAANVANLEHKAALITMAETWEALARSRERALRRANKEDQPGGE